MKSSSLLWGFLAATLVVAAAARADEGAPAKAVPGKMPPETHSTPYLPPPPPPPLPPPRTPPLFEAPSPPPSSAPGLPPGPVTNYGTGGMQAPPGAPPNPPYPPGGLMH